MKSPNLDEKVHEFNGKVFWGSKMDEWRNTMLHQILRWLPFQHFPKKLKPQNEIIDVACVHVYL